MAALSDIGITTGAPYRQRLPDRLLARRRADGQHQTLTAAIQNNPAGVQKLLASFSQSFQNLVNNESGPGGVISQRSPTTPTETTQMCSQIQHDAGFAERAPDHSADRILDARGDTGAELRRRRARSSPKSPSP